MPVSTQTKPPCKFVAGDTVIFSVSGEGHPSSLWNLDYFISRNGTNLITKRAYADGNDFLVTLSGTESNIVPGAANWNIAVTEISSGERKFTCSGVISIEFNPATGITPTENMTLLAAANAALLKLASSGNYKVEFNEQMFERHRIKDLMNICDRLQVAVWAELRGMGIQQPGGSLRLQTRF
jgi:hypothetical protein